MLKPALSELVESRRARAQRERPGRRRHFRQVAGGDLAVVGPLELVLGAELGEDEEWMSVGQSEVAADLGRKIEDAIVEAVAGKGDGDGYVKDAAREVV